MIDMKEYLVDFCTFCGYEEKRTIAVTDNFTVWLSLGQIVEGYCLIIPNEHYHCIGSMSEDLWKEFIELKDKVRQVLTSVYGGCIFFEHGRVGACNVQPGEQLCYHAHLHAVPMKKDLLPYFEESLVPIRLKESNDLFNYYKKIGHYLYYEDTEQNQFMFFINHPIRRQFLRFLAAKSIGKEELADWNKYPGWSEINRAKKKLIPYFS